MTHRPTLLTEGARPPWSRLLGTEPAITIQKAVVIQNYVPAYRVPLFEEMFGLLEAQGVHLTVVHGTPHGELQRRRDATTGRSWQLAGASWRLPLAGRSIGYIRVGRLLDRETPVVVELSLSSLNMWAALLRRPSRTILWGHGRMYVKRSHRATDGLRVWACKKAAHTMTYSEGGRQWLIDHGVPSERVTSIGNSTDTDLLKRARAASEADALRMKDELDTHGPTALYVGALDKDKRIDFLLDAAAAAHVINPSFRLLIAGDGQLRSLVSSREQEPWLRHLGPIAPEQLAALSWIADAIWMPGRIGLIAVDALAVKLPVLTTPFPYHAPEVEFLAPGTSLHILPDDPDKFASSALILMNTLILDPQSTPSISNVAEAASRVIAGVFSESHHA